MGACRQTLRAGLEQSKGLAEGRDSVLLRKASDLKDRMREQLCMGGSVLHRMGPECMDPHRFEEVVESM
jgi:hypothetical protein